MIEQIVAEIFERIGHVWMLDSGLTVPTEDDVHRMLDAAAKALYDSPIGTQFQTGGLVIEKAPTGHDVYVFVGNYT